MLRWIDRANDALLFLLGLGLIAMIGISTWNVISRYVFNRALMWADEAAVFGMIALAFLGAVVCGWRNVEIRMDILTDMLPGLVKRLILIAQQAVIALLCGWVAVQALVYIKRAYAIGMRSDASGFPVWLMHAVIPFSLTLIAAIAVLRGFRLILGGEPTFSRTPDQGTNP